MEKEYMMKDIQKKLWISIEMEKEKLKIWGNLEGIEHS